MGRNPGSRQETNTERASRVRENKRRHRARQKEYILDLEHKVAETREQGIQVTKEVQLAAQKVTRENAKLRDLLRRAGYTDDVVDAWLEAHNISLNEGNPVPMKPSESGECSTESSLPVESHNKKSEVSPTQASSAVCTKSSSLSQCSNSEGAPCKLVTLLAKNPAADITQVRLPTESDNQQGNVSKPDDCNSDGIECSTAYQMLMQYATSEEKMDRIAAALESGCTPSAAGGCKVKKSVVWTALDEECT
ncbi:hypothetical protein CC80DRAFT_471670 [Byssothecium circinans]|uniref:BZIP domain-containing protein n=1 Tax=Byssothecium circinans TaxID=147558 RepID=A0A6A5TX01_9PLEO|nr:hypothetical protein CC80DRAFT_471670 [Byssothecium circinans]